MSGWIGLELARRIERSMTERIERELLLRATRDQVSEVVTGAGWLADEVELDLVPGGDAVFRSRGSVKMGWVEDASAPARLAF